jgi:hypothetical protein
MSCVQGAECEDYDECEVGVGGRASDLRSQASGKTGLAISRVGGLTGGVASVE